MNLTLFILVPLLTALLVLLVRGAAQVKWVSLLGSAVQLVMCLVLLNRFWTARASGVVSRYLFESRLEWFGTLNIYYHTGIDGVSVALMLLTAVVVLAGVLVSWNMTRKVKEYFFLLVLLGLGAYGFFVSLDMFLFFFFLEIAVIPKYLIIGIWGSGRKESSANKLALMLMGGSALVLIGMLGFYYAGGRSFDMSAAASLDIATQRWVFPLLFTGFGVFTAIFPFHTWVPDGHSSAPTAGSMFLAGISMKLGGYGCLRVVGLMPQAAAEYAPAIVMLAAIAILYGAFATMMQKDLKYINAYSSISHCGFVLLGIGMLTRTALAGAVMQMVSHGLMTALFFAVIGMIYERTHTRLVRQMSGLMKAMPFVCTALFIAGLCSLGLPGLSGFAAEMTIFVGAWQRADLFYRLATVAACMSIVVTAVYILRATGQVAMGPARDASAPDGVAWTDARWNERLAAILLIAGIVLIGVAPAWLLDLVSHGSGIAITNLDDPSTIIP